jgi:hypothetical protein
VEAGEGRTAHSDGWNGVDHYSNYSIEREIIGWNGVDGMELNVLHSISLTPFQPLL